MKDRKDISRKELSEWLTNAEDQPPKAQEIEQTEDALLGFALAHAVPPPPEVRRGVLDALNKMAKENKDRIPSPLPDLSGESDRLFWEKIAAGIEPPDYENIHLHPLEESEQRSLFVAWVREFIPEEVHHDLLESFLILEGSCTCYIRDPNGKLRIVHLSDGDFIEMALGDTHDIRITSPRPAKAILQWKRLTA